MGDVPTVSVIPKLGQEGWEGQPELPEKSLLGWGHQQGHTFNPTI